MGKAGHPPLEPGLVSYRPGVVVILAKDFAGELPPLQGLGFLCCAVTRGDAPGYRIVAPLGLGEVSCRTGVMRWLALATRPHQSYCFLRFFRASIIFSNFRMLHPSNWMSDSRFIHSTSAKFARSAGGRSD